MRKFLLAFLTLLLIITTFSCGKVVHHGEKGIEDSSKSAMDVEGSLGQAPEPELSQVAIDIGAGESAGGSIEGSAPTDEGKTIRELINTLDDSEEGTREFAKGELVKIGSPAVSEIIGSIKGNEALEEIKEVLKQIVENSTGDEKRENIRVIYHELLELKDKSKRGAIQEILVALGPDVAPDLIHPLTSDEIGTYVEDVLVKHGQSIIDPLLDVLEKPDTTHEQREKIENALARVASEDEPALSALIDTFYEHRQPPMMYDSLRRIFDTLINENTNKIIEQLFSGDPEVNGPIKELLKRLKDVEEQVIYSNFVITDNIEDVKTVFKAQNNEEILSLCDKIKEISSPVERTPDAQTLASKLIENSAQIVKTLIKSEENEPAKRVLILMSNEALPELIKALDDNQQYSQILKNTFESIIPNSSPQIVRALINDNNTIRKTAKTAVINMYKAAPIKPIGSHIDLDNSQKDDGSDNKSRGRKLLGLFLLIVVVCGVGGVVYFLWIKKKQTPSSEDKETEGKGSKKEAVTDEHPAEKTRCGDKYIEKDEFSLSPGPTLATPDITTEKTPEEEKQPTHIKSWDSEQRGEQVIAPPVLAKDRTGTDSNLRYEVRKFVRDIENQIEAKTRDIKNLEDKLKRLSDNIKTVTGYYYETLDEISKWPDDLRGQFQQELKQELGLWKRDMESELNSKITPALNDLKIISSNLTQMESNLKREIEHKLGGDHTNK